MLCRLVQFSMERHRASGVFLVEQEMYTYQTVVSNN